MLRLYDGLNHVRRLMEKDGRAPRSIISSMIMLPAGEAAVWCWDAPNAKASRQKIYPPYKAKRLPPPDNLWPTIDLIRKALRHTRALQIMVPGFEADDVIATLCRSHTDVDIEVYSNDGDLRQLCVNRRVKVNATNKQPAHLIRLFKTWVGDPSDNITGVKGFGEGAWDDASKDTLQNITDDLLKGNALAEADLADLKPGVRKWLLENREQFIAMWTITGLLSIPPELMAENTKVGVADPVAASAVLSEFFL